MWNPYNGGATASTSKSDTSDQASDPNDKDVSAQVHFVSPFGNVDGKAAKGVTPSGNDIRRHLVSTIVDSWQ